MRLSGWDYSWPAHYAVTIRVATKGPVLGHLADETIVLTKAGAIVARTMAALPERIPTVRVLGSVIMPDHVHFIIELRGGGPSLSMVVGAFKSLAAHAVNGETGSKGPMWQRGFHDRVIRSERELVGIFDYIQRNPERLAAKVRARRNQADVGAVAGARPGSRGARLIWRRDETAPPGRGKLRP